MGRKSSAGGSAAVLLTLIMAALAWAAPGDLDPSFDGDGTLTTDFGAEDFATSVALQPDGKIVAAGHVRQSYSIAVARYNPDGSLDASFSGDGKQTAPGGGENADVAVQPDGKIVVVGTALTGDNTNDFQVLRYHPDGSPDAGFDGDGVQTTNFGDGYAEAYAVALQPDGKIVVGGFANPSLALARYNGDGSLDSTFSGDGMQTSSSYAIVRDLALQSDGKIVVAGLQGAGGSYFPLLARYNADGSPDSLGPYGAPTTYHGAADLNGVAVQPDGRILVVGLNIHGFAVARYNSDGSPDTSFSGDGEQANNFSGTSDRAYHVLVQPDGRIVAGGVAGSANYDFLVARYNPDGSVDTGYGSGGAKITDFGGRDEIAEIALQPDGKVVAAGRFQVAENGVPPEDFAVARYEGGGPAPPGSPAPGGTTTGGTVGGGSPGGTTLLADRTAPIQLLGGRRVQDIDSLALTVQVNEDATVRVSGGISLPGVSKVVRFRTVTRSLKAGVKSRIRLVLSRKSLKAVKRSLARRRRLIAKVASTATDSAGNRSAVTRRIRLKD